jgi:pimeloyl-ACP methyl ester carboxylesterase
MKEPWLTALNSFKNVASAMQGIHWIARGIFKQKGYSWELRRAGEVKLGLWKKKLRPKSQRSPYPKRFILIPGFGDTPLSWFFVMSLLAPVLKKNFDEVVFIDFPGFGGFLSKERSFPTMDLMLSVLGDTLDSLKPHTILGHSLGGWITAHYAAQCGQGIRPSANRLNYSGPHSVILANPSGIFTDEKTKLGLISIFESSRKHGFEALRPHLFAKEPPWFGMLVADFQKFIRREDILQFMDSIRDEHVVEGIARQIKSKVWLLWGEKDTLVPASCSRVWLEKLNSEFKSEHHVILLKKSGHSPHLEQPTITAVILAQILAEKTPHRFGKRWWTVVGNELTPYG